MTDFRPAPRLGAIAPSATPGRSRTGASAARSFTAGASTAGSPTAGPSIIRTGVLGSARTLRLALLFGLPGLLGLSPFHPGGSAFGQASVEAQAVAGSGIEPRSGEAPSGQTAAEGADPTRAGTDQADPRHAEFGETGAVRTDGEGATLVRTAGDSIAGPASDDNAATSSSPADQHPMTLAEVAPGVWVHTSWQELDGGTWFPANGLLVLSGDALTLVDTGWGDGNTERLLAVIEAKLGLPVTRAVVTHFHADSMGGTAALARRGVEVLGSPLTRELGAGEGVPLPEGLEALRVAGGAARVGNVEVFYPGPGHSRDNLTVWVPEAKVLFGSCAVRTPSFPGRGNTTDADLEGWPLAMERLLERYPDVRIVVPGHGPLGDGSLLTHTRSLFPKPAAGDAAGADAPQGAKGGGGEVEGRRGGDGSGRRGGGSDDTERKEPT